MTTETMTKKLQEIITKIEKELGVQIKVIRKISSYSIIFSPDEEYPDEKVLIIYNPEEGFYVTFAFEKETTLMMSEPRKNLKLADKVIEKIKEGLKYES